MRGQRCIFAIQIAFCISGLYLCLCTILVCFHCGWWWGGSRVVVVFHPLFARNHQRLIAEGKLLANTAGSKQKAPQKRHRYQDTHGIRCRRCFQKHSMINQIYIFPLLSIAGIEKLWKLFLVKYLFLSFLPPAIRWVPMIHRKLGLVIKAEISIPLLKIMRTTDVPGIQIFSPNQGYCQASKEKGY